MSTGLTLKSLLDYGVETLKGSDQRSAALEARVLLQHLLKKTHEYIVLNPTATCTPEQAEEYQAWLARRLAGEPVAKITQHREFYSLPFFVTEDVLDPRSDTEILIETALARLPVDAPLRLLDLGTGSGCILLTLLHHRPQATGIGVDISPKALAVAQENANRLGLSDRVTWHQGDWTTNLPQETFDCIASNPPYICHSDIGTLSLDVKNYDPHVALDGGKDGLVCYRQIAHIAPSLLKKGGFLILEIGEGQADDVDAICKKHHLARANTWVRDLANIPRCATFEFTLR